jgi:signal transduction histidine kinase/ligand-binding sensor domain-containing protein/DNA-binding response OmpR family regulator
MSAVGEYNSISSFLKVPLCVLLLFAVCSSLSAQEVQYSFDKLTIHDGLSNNEVSSILQDKRGFIWISTTEGLNRYDGSSIKVYENNSRDQKSLINNEIACQYIDKKGNLWVGTNGGVSLYDTNSDNFINFPLSETRDRGISYTRTKGFFEDSDNNLYVGMESGWIYRFNPKTKNLDLFDTLRFREITTSKVTPQNKLIIGTLNGLVLSDLHSRTTERILEGRPTDIVLIDGEMIWIGVRSGGLYHYQLSTKQLTQIPSPTPRYNNVWGLFKDSKNNIWVTGSVLRVYNREDGKFYRITDDEHTLATAGTSAFLEDADGNYWISLYYGGIRIVRKTRQFSFYKADDSSSPRLTNKVVSSLSMDKDKNLWVGYYEGGIDIINRKTGSVERIVPGDTRYNLQPGSVFMMQQDSDGEMWVGAYRAGLHRFGSSRRSFDVYRTNPGVNGSIASNDIRSMLEYSPGNFWFLTHSKGIDLYSKKTNAFAHYRQPNPEVVMDEWGFQLLKDRKGDVWYGASSGLFRISGKDYTLKLFNKNSGDSTSLSDNSVNCIHEDSKGNLWIGTANGLNLLNKEGNGFRHFTKNEGLPNNTINAINEDGNGGIWVSTNKGLFFLSLDTDGKAIVKNYDFSDGLLDQQFYPRATFKDNETGILYFGGISGITWFHPDSITERSPKLNVVFTNFYLANNPVVPGAKDSPLKSHISSSQSVRLKHEQKVITFEFVAPYFSGAKKVHYAYMMDGFNRSWNYVGTEQKATYTNLDPGEYTFKVKASHNGLDWSSPESSIKVVILPPWWSTTWAKIVYLILVFALLFVYRKVSLKQANLLHNLKLERIKRENIEKLNQAKLEFFTNVSHEFRTPLTLILGPVHTLLDNRKGGKLFRDQLLVINNNAQRLLRLVNQLLDFRKAESGNMKLEVMEGNMVRFVKEIKLSFEPLAEEMEIDFAYHADKPLMPVWFDRYQCEKIFFNLLSNAFKNTPRGGRIAVEVLDKDEYVVVRVCDTGRGIKEEHFNHIFEAFFSHYEDHRQASTGIGLALAKSLIEMHHGKIEVESKENEYTNFSVWLKKGKEHFDASEIAFEMKEGSDNLVYPSATPDNQLKEHTVAEPVKEVDHLPKILLIEDNQDVRNYLKSIFEFDYIILEASNGKEGLEVVNNDTPEVIISDVMMPEMDGMSFCKEIKSNVKTSHIPVILLTARTSMVYTIEGLEKGADDYVTKPFNPKVLQLKVRNLLRAQEAMRRAFKDQHILEIEPKAVVLNSVDEKFISQVFEVIEKHISNPDFTAEVLSREVGMSRAQLYRKIRAVSGQSVNDLVRTFRLRRAAQLLRQKQLNVSQITYEVGFTDLQYFRECFKKFFGVTPSEYNESVSEDAEQKGQ